MLKIKQGVERYLTSKARLVALQLFVRSAQMIGHIPRYNCIGPEAGGPDAGRTEDASDCPDRGERSSALIPKLI